MAYKSIRPYVIRDGKSYCRKCGRRRLARIVGTRWMCCPYDDHESVVEDGPALIVVRDQLLLCGQCGRSEMVPGPGGIGRECAVCDLPVSTREGAPAPRAVYLALPGLARAGGAGDAGAQPFRPNRPEALVTACPRCGQTCLHDFEWRFNQWYAVCNGCGNRLTVSRTKAVRAEQKEGPRG